MHLSAFVIFYCARSRRSQGIQPGLLISNHSINLGGAERCEWASCEGCMPDEESLTRYFIHVDSLPKYITGREWRIFKLHKKKEKDHTWWYFSITVRKKDHTCFP
jgi:hypothetical protein